MATIQSNGEDIINVPDVNLNPDSGGFKKPDLGGEHVLRPLSITNDEVPNQNLGEGATNIDENGLIHGTDFGVDDIWRPDTSVDADSNVSSLFAWLYRFIQHAGIADINAGNVAANYIQIMNGIAQSVKNLFANIGYERKDNQGAIIDIIEKVTNIAQSYLDQLYGQVLSYQSWYLQQEYNSPVNQLNRLRDAHLSSAFVFGSYSNTASSPASLSPNNGASSVMSGAGAVAEQGRANSIADKQRIGSAILESGRAVGELLKVGVDSYKTLAEADNIEKLTPVQVASALQQFRNLGVQHDYVRTQIKSIESDIASEWFKNDFALYQHQVSSAGEMVDSSRQALADASKEDFALSMGSKIIETCTYSGDVTTRSGQLVHKDYTLDELQTAWKNGGYDEEGNRVFSEDDYRIESKGELKGSLAFPDLGFGIGGKGSLGSSLGNKEGNSKDSRSGSNFESSSGSKVQNSHYDDETRTLTIGNQKFVRTTTRKLMQSKEYIDYMNNQKSKLLKDYDHFYELTRGERSNFLDNIGLYLENKVDGLKWSAVGKLRYFMKNSSSEPVQVGD